VRIAELGVDYGQGFAIGKPIPLSDLLTELPLPSEPPSEGPPEGGAAGDGDEMTWFAGVTR